VHHLVHSDCLVRAGRALNSNGQRYGVSAFGNRAGYPLCAQPVSFWVDYKEAAAFPIFWMHRVQAKMDEIGLNEGSIPIHRIKKMLKNDPTLTNRQKTYLRDRDSAGIGFPQAMEDGSRAFISEVINGGPENGGSICCSLKPGP
jgi:hypothetical protein